MSDDAELKLELERLQKRASRWKAAAKSYRDRYLDLCVEMDDIIDGLLDDDGYVPPVEQKRYLN